MKKTILLTVIAVCFSLIAMVGCGSDSATVSNLIAGDTSSATFQFMRDSIGETSFDITGLGMDVSFGLLGQQFPGAGASKLTYNSKSTSDSAIIVSNSYLYQNNWHIFQYSATFIDAMTFDTTTVEGIDSIQTLADNVPVAIPDSTVNMIKIRAQYAFQNNRFGSGVGHQSFDLSAVPNFEPLSTITVNGNSNDTLDFRFGENADTCTLDMNNSLSITGVVFLIDSVDSGNECPESGTIVAQQNILLNCIGGTGSSLDSLNIDGSWTATLTFNGATSTVSFTDGTTSWSYTETCLDPGTSANPGLSGISGFSIKQ